MATAADSVKTMARGAFPALGAKIGIIENEIALATASAELVAQGDGVLATDDLIQALSIPAGTLVLAAGLEVTEAIAGASDLDVDLGDETNDDLFVAAFDADGASVGDHAPIVAAGCPKVYGAADTLDIHIHAATGTVTAGKLRVYAVVADVDGLDG